MLKFQVVVISLQSTNYCDTIKKPSRVILMSVLLLLAKQLKYGNSCKSEKVIWLRYDHMTIFCV